MLTVNITLEENEKAFGQIQDDQRNFRNIIRGIVKFEKIGTLWINFNHWSNDYCKSKDQRKPNYRGMHFKIRLR